MDGVSCSPAKHKVPSGKEDDAEKCWHETMLWLSQAVFLDVWDEVFVLVDEECGNTDGTGNTDCDETETHFSEIEVIDWGKDELENLEERIIDSVSERGLIFVRTLSSSKFRVKEGRLT